MKDQKLLPCAKNGKFLGYATKEQIEGNERLSIFDITAKSEKEEEEEKKQKEVIQRPSIGADPSAIRRGPGRPRKN